MKALPIRQREQRARQSLRLDPDIWGALDAMREQRPGTVSRNTWIAEAVLEKLQRESASSPHRTAGGEGA
jgi:hypothetical protein